MVSAEKWLQRSRVRIAATSARHCAAAPCPEVIEPTVRLHPSGSGHNNIRQRRSPRDPYQRRVCDEACAIYARPQPERAVPGVSPSHLSEALP